MLPKTQLERRDAFYRDMQILLAYMRLVNNMNSKCLVLGTSDTSWTRVDVYILLMVYIMRPSDDTVYTLFTVQSR